MNEGGSSRQSPSAPADSRASEALWHAHRERIMQFIRRRVEDDAADDLLQEVFLRMYRNIDRLSRHDNPRAWLYRVARSVIIDHYRASRPMQSLPDDLREPEPEHSEEAVRELARCLDPLIERLPERYREAIRLSEIEGLTQQQVAERQGLSHSGAKSRVQRGRERLREMITDCCRIERDHAGRIHDYETNPGKGCNC